VAVATEKKTAVATAKKAEKVDWEKRAREAEEAAERARLEASQEKARADWQAEREAELERQVAAEVMRRETEALDNRTATWIELGASAYRYWSNESIRGGQSSTPPIDFLTASSNLQVAERLADIADKVDQLVCHLNSKEQQR
jgi:hypothetical protein